MADATLAHLDPAGLYLAEHGVRDNVSPLAGRRRAGVADLLKQRDSYTAAFVSSVVLSRQSGLARGFDEHGSLRRRRGRCAIPQHDPEAR
ncbi:MAG: hypothetical protein R2712_04290 [Vicinamibacterales bacterium]